jgi:para-nitrobenzyl esterase
MKLTTCFLITASFFHAWAQSPASDSATDLSGPTWQLVRFQSSDGQTLTPDDKSKYTILFEPNGQANARIDCNRGHGSWKSSQRNDLMLGTLALTRAMCPQQAVSDRLAKDWTNIRSYTLHNGHLFLGLQADGGIYEFEPSVKTARVDGGLLEGSESNGVLAFKGVPFAEPPVGNLRWRAPKPVKRWTGVHSAASFGHDCMQLPVPGDAAPLATTPSEDCLFLNIWRPAEANPGEKLPVMFWIHGGAYLNGGTSSPVYDGSAIARQGIIFVSANYRLGRFGFFAHPALIAAQEGPVGDFAYMDQIAALHWVKRNIAAFGGNPERVTVVGESAGGDSIMHVLTSPEGTGLFERAVVMSGDGRTHLVGGYELTGGTRADPSADQIGVNFARSVGISGVGPDTLRALRALDAHQVVGDLNMASAAKPTSGPLTHCEGAIVDGIIVIDSPGKILARAQAPLIPILIGTTSGDLGGKIPTPSEDPLGYFGLDADKARAMYPSLDIYQAMGADINEHEPARFVARQVTRDGAPAYLFRFGYVADSQRPNVLVAVHESDIPFFFSTLAARYQTGLTDRDQREARTADRYLVNFIKTGDPNGSGLPLWQKFDPAHPILLMFTPEGGAAMQPDPLKDRLDLVEHTADAQ